MLSFNRGIFTMDNLLNIFKLVVIVCVGICAICLMILDLFSIKFYFLDLCFFNMPFLIFSVLTPVMLFLIQEVTQKYFAL